MAGALSPSVEAIKDLGGLLSAMGSLDRVRIQESREAFVVAALGTCTLRRGESVRPHSGETEIAHHLGQELTLHVRAGARPGGAQHQQMALGLVAREASTRRPPQSLTSFIRAIAGPRGCLGK